MSEQPHGLRNIHGIRPLYLLPDDPFLQEVLIPSFASSSSVDCMVGFFRSEVLASLAPGLATFINQSEGTFRLVVSPVLQAQDWKAIEAGTSKVEDIVRSVFDDVLVTPNTIERHTLDCLSWLLRKGRMEIQIALMDKALFHPKVWLFHDDVGSTICAHGSTNMTNAGMHRNIEQVAVSKSWGDEDDLYTIRRLMAQFGDLWSNSVTHCKVVPIPHAIRQQLVQLYTSQHPPSEVSLQTTSEQTHALEDLSTTLSDEEPLSFHIPSGLRYQDGPYAHQGEAVEAWCAAGHHGVLEMATGAGKTITAMIAAHRLYQEHRPLLIVIAAPYIPLVQQWCTEVRFFGLLPIDLTEAIGNSGRARILGGLRRRLRSGLDDIAAVVVTHDSLKNTQFQSDLASFDATTLLIGDEVHGLGSDGFTAAPADFFDFRLGLSATPERQYDTEGTEAILDFFGPIVYRYSLEQAIGTCLVPYDYFVHAVMLTETEMDRWHDLTEAIRKNSWRDDNGPDSYLQKLLRDRRAVLESAVNKIDALREALTSEGVEALRHTLIYASDKDPEQLNQVNRLLIDLGIQFHQLTYEETANRSTTQRILRAFQDGDLQVLTAKRVLDEGVNIPQIKKAYILASTTVERQWVQRRGRLLRQCAALGKRHAEIHDFVALPSDVSYLDKGDRRVVQSELTRVQEFARLARNAGLPGGPLEMTRKLVQATYE